MFVTSLALRSFRCYEQAELELDAGVNLFLGANGQGKTNLLESVEYVATLGSHRVATDAPLIAKGADTAMVQIQIQAGLKDERRVLARLDLIAGKANKASLNRSPLRRPRDLLGYLRVVLFAPTDLGLVHGDPTDRRNFIDELLTSRWPRFAEVRANYERVLKQRSTLLKSMGALRQPTAEMEATLQIWDESLVKYGAELTHARLTTLDALLPLLATAYAQIAPTQDLAQIDYKSAATVSAAMELPELQSNLLAALQERRREEIVRGVTLIGPHRDDLTFCLGDFPAKGYASHGESWSFALALKLAAFRLLQVDGIEPVLLLDDVFAELDEVRRERLADTALTAEQVLITAAVEQDVPKNLTGKRFSVASGTVEVLETL